MFFRWGLYYFVCVGVMLTKEKVACTTLCTTYVEKNTTKKHPQHYIFLGECLSSSVQMYNFLHGNTTLVIFSNQHGNICVLYNPVYNQVCMDERRVECRIKTTNSHNQNEPPLPYVPSSSFSPSLWVEQQCPQLMTPWLPMGPCKAHAIRYGCTMACSLVWGTNACPIKK
jgi:hypothetical protein